MKQLRVVVADDSQRFRNTLIMLLRRQPYLQVVGEAEDGEAALRCVEEMSPDLLLLDLQMPKLDGWQVLQILQTRGSRVTVFVLSTEVHHFPAALTAGRGAAAYLSKDEPAVLLKAIADLADQFGLRHP